MRSKSSTEFSRKKKKDTHTFTNIQTHLNFTLPHTSMEKEPIHGSYMTKVKRSIHSLITLHQV